MATNIIVPTAWLTTLLDDLINGTLGTPTIQPYTNNYVPVDSSVIGDFTLNLSFGPTPFSTWAAAFLSGATAIKMQSATIAILQNQSSVAVATVYGYVVFDGAGNPLWAQADPSAPVLVPYTANYYVQPGFSVNSLF